MGWCARKANWILVMACVLMALCFVQRILNMPVAYPALSSVQSETVNSGTETAVTPCELSAKSLQTPEPLPDGVIPFLILLIALALTAYRLIITSPPQEETFSPPPERYLTFCVFRE